MLKAIRAVQTLQDLPEAPIEVSYFSPGDFWHYVAISDGKLCEYCGAYDGQTFPGSELQTTFPDLEIIFHNMIHPHVHQMLVDRGIFGEWTRDSCRCLLIRESQS
jgi:hypothetical protein